jgi:ribosomal protein S18 acetylase RimI-like enzyme
MRRRGADVRRARLRPSPHDGVLGLLDTDPEALLVVESDGIVGSLIVAWDGWWGSFYRLSVHPDRRRQGIATALLHEGSAVCRPAALPGSQR